VSEETLTQQHHHYHALRVARVIDETPDARSFVVEIPPERVEAFAYQAGQHLTFKVRFDGRDLLRCYSLSSSPECESEHKVTVKRIAGGSVSNWMNDNVSAGDVVQVLPPAGRFVLREADRPLVLFAGGSGITPVISLIKSALVRTARPMKLVYANRDAASIIFEAELRELRTRHADRLEVVHSLDDSDGYLTSERVQAQLAGHADAHFYLCGPGAFMEAVEQGLEAAGIPRDAVFKELFVSPEDDVPTAEERASTAEADAGAAGCETLLVTVDGATHELAYEGGKTVLQTARDAGVQPPFSCEDGYCSCCMAKLIEGEVKMRKNDCLTPRDLEDGWVLACQSVPQTKTVKIDWDAG
jgi:3-ketosteroid 9alpha-monooxygenase subunit B